MLDKTVVPGEPTSPVPQGTPTPSPVTPEVTPTQTPEDARLKEFEGKLAQYEADIARQKSTFQKREYEMQQAAQARERELRAQIEQARVADMDDDERKIYEQEQAVVRARELEEQVQRLEAEKQEQVAFNQAYSWFLQNDVPAKELVTDQGYDALFQSGWAFINTERQRLRQTAAQPAPTPAPAPAPAPVAPKVVTTIGGTPIGGPTWDDLVAKYGSREQVYRLVETQQLPASIIPGMNKP